MSIEETGYSNSGGRRQQKEEYEEEKTATAVHIQGEPPESEEGYGAGTCRQRNNHAGGKVGRLSDASLKRLGSY